VVDPSNRCILRNRQLDSNRLRIAELTTTPRDQSAGSSPSSPLSSLPFCLHVASLSRALCTTRSFSRARCAWASRVVWPHSQSKTRFSGNKSSAHFIPFSPVSSTPATISIAFQSADYLPFPPSHLVSLLAASVFRDESHLGRYSALSALGEPLEVRLNGGVSCAVVYPMQSARIFSGKHRGLVEHETKVTRESF